MSAEDKLREIAALHGWPDELLEQVRTLFAVECNVAFDHGRRVERQMWDGLQSSAQVDAARYRWLKARKELDLRSKATFWLAMDGSTFWSTHTLAADGTEYVPAESLDAMIDKAITRAQP